MDQQEKNKRILSMIILLCVILLNVILFKAILLSFNQILVILCTINIVYFFVPKVILSNIIFQNVTQQNTLASNKH